MHSKFLRTTMALHLLLLIMIGYVIGGEMNPHQNHHHHHEGQSSSSSSSPHHMDHSELVFFTLNDLKVGNKIPIFFRSTNNNNNNNNNNSPHFLPREESEKIPFSHSKLPYLLQLFGFSQGSSQAQAMEDTLRHCETDPIQGETKLCATSLESMLDFVHQIFGSTTNFRVLSTQNLAKYNNNILQNYTIVDEPIEVFAPKMVACHTVPYPYVVYYCHYQESQSKVFQISLRVENENNNNLNGNNDNNIVKAIGVCHMDTSQWSINHISFKVLGIKPGSSPVCHFFPEDNLVWVPTTATNIEGSREKVSAM